MVTGPVAKLMIAVLLLMIDTMPVEAGRCPDIQFETVSQALLVAPVKISVAVANALSLRSVPLYTGIKPIPPTFKLLSKKSPLLEANVITWKEFPATGTNGLIA